MPTNPDTSLAGCPKCGVGPGVEKENMSPAQWIECVACGFSLGPWKESWRDLSRLRRPTPAPEMVERVARAIGLIDHDVNCDELDGGGCDCDRRVWQAKAAIAAMGGET